MTPRSSCPGGESTPLQGANLRLHYEISNVTDTEIGNLARGTPSFCRSGRGLSYRLPGSLLESRGGSVLARAEVSESAIGTHPTAGITGISAESANGKSIEQLAAESPTSVGLRQN